ncbi:bifunctional diguanylate cyclase/phosphodiesterase [Metasolibacillus meyeri]|uniref:Bifunctional diguanylate cyclase/phosphodiesterase n=1 Tax=Metasolibacillus meyeri TaxID=1071052 RepID=A0AAW9NUZ9_9BACL|nr:bifunctional diguanylate cyclase/phosphodiesterase [Metasolibacillus meyeri]MEC1178721.1 bifunctional diguanylate cyclase/phosphodiesterase [Metasolibacillus meyeri]
MIKHNVNNLFEKIIQLNPFDAIVVLQYVEQKYVVQHANCKAVHLFNCSFEEGMDAGQFFHQINWSEVKQFILQNDQETKRIKIDDVEIAVVLQTMMEQGKEYTVIIMRSLLTSPIIDNQRLHIMSSAYYDELTELYNRRALNKQWTDHDNFEKTSNVALLLVDLDRFKKFNESLGKQRSDRLLFEVSERFRSLRSEYCEVFRHNGDEFVIIFHYEALEEVETLAYNILQSLQEPFIVDNQEYFVSASVGIALSTIEERDLDNLLHQADQALFYIKNNGRGHYCYYREELKHYFPNEALMEAHLHRAIELKEFMIYFQPQVNLETNKIDSFEALIRWENRKFGMVSPAQFIPIAESSGLIISIGEWVLERVCQYQKEWREYGFKPVRIAVNISPKQFKQKDFVKRISALLQQYKVEPKYLELEITESSMTNLHETTSILSRLKEIGVYVSVDDFGTGYSSLSYLKEYPIDIIKIDQSFITDIEKDRKNKAIVETIILLAQNLGLEVIAEGVEETAQEQFLRENNCQKVQGYLYNRPLPANQIVEQYFH